jgi:ABC-type transport system substrate-binding protein
MELVALVFARDPQSAEESRQREALALSIARGLLNTVLLQGGGEPAGSLLPNWMTGYAFLFPSDSDPAKARQSAKDVGQAISWTLSYDTSDSLARVIAERIVLNARDSGLSLQLKPGSTADARLVRLPLASLAPNVALKRLAAGLGLSQPKFANQSAESLYWTEKALLQSQRVIPLLHLRFAFGRNATVKNWTLQRDGSWRLDAVWLGAEKP